MRSAFRWIVGAAAIAAAAILVGCEPGDESYGKKSSAPAGIPSPPSPSAPAESEKERSQSPLEQSEESAEESQGDIEENLSSLSAEDRALVDAQKFCPVSSEELGSMGVPVKVTVKDETFFLCCPDCKKDVVADPDKYIAKVRELRKTHSGDGDSGDEAQP